MYATSVPRLDRGGAACMSTAASHPRLLSCALLLALVSAQCAQSPESPTAPSAVVSRGIIPQAGGGPVSGDTLPPLSALGATRFLAFGDSITCGTPSSFDVFSFDINCKEVSGYPQLVRGALQNVSPTQTFTVINEGRPGEWAQQAISSGRFGQLMASVRPQGLLLLEGFNDLNSGSGIGATVNALQQMVELARLYNTTVLIGTMFQTCQSTSPTGIVRPNAYDRITAFNSAVKAMATGRQNVYVVDVYVGFGNNCDANGGVGWLGADGLHPSSSGYTALASIFTNALRNVFAVRGSYQ
jgi:lysophospholipase L1-like esterase